MLIESVLWIILFVAIGICDFKVKKVYNFLIVTGYIIACVSQVHDSGYFGIASFLITMFLPVLLLWPMYWLRVFGAGDLKVSSVIFSCFGILSGLRIMWIALCIAAIYSVIKLFYHHNFQNRMIYFLSYIKKCITLQKVETYYVAERDGTDVIIPFCTCLSVSAIAFVFSL